MNYCYAEDTDVIDVRAYNERRVCVDIERDIEVSGKQGICL